MKKMQNNCLNIIPMKQKLNEKLSEGELKHNNHSDISDLSVPSRIKLKCERSMAS